MKAVIETIEPIIRPATTRPTAVATPRRLRAIEFVPVRSENTLFHAWRA